MNGSFSEMVFTQLKEKAILRFEGPLGSFSLREESEKPILLLASGTGFAPVKAMLEHAFHHNIKRPITFYWGAHNLSHLYMLNLPKKWEQEHAHFKFVPILSDPEPHHGVRSINVAFFFRTHHPSPRTKHGVRPCI